MATNNATSTTQDTGSQVLGMIPYVGGAAVAGWKALTGQNGDDEQLKQQAKLQQQQIQGAEQLSEFNYQQQLKMMNATSYGWQKEQMEKAGLNPALMYGNSGSGGTTGSGTVPMPTEGTPSDSASRQNADTNQVLSMLQIGMSEAQQEVLKSQAEKNRADANLSNTQSDKIAGVDTENVTADTASKQLHNDYQTIINRIQAATEQVQTAVGQEMPKAQLQDITNSAELKQAQAGILSEQQKQIQENIENTVADTLLKQANTQLTYQQAKQISQQIAQKWTEINIMQAKTGAEHTDRVKMMETILKAAGIQAAGNVANTLIKGGIE